MEIKTKYDMHQEVFYMYENNIHKGKINVIKVSLQQQPPHCVYAPDGKEHIINYPLNIRITYSFFPGGCFGEDEIFETQAELLESIRI